MNLALLGIINILCLTEYLKSIQSRQKLPTILMQNHKVLILINRSVFKSTSDQLHQLAIQLLLKYLDIVVFDTDLEQHSKITVKRQNKCS